MGLEVIRRPAIREPVGTMLARHGWKIGLGIAVAAMVATAATRATVHVQSRPVAITSVPCGALPSGNFSNGTSGLSWIAGNGPYILPDASCAGVTVPAGKTLTIAAGTQVLSHGTGITVLGRMVANGTSASPVVFDADPGAGAWNGLTFASVGPARGNGALTNATISNVATGITATSGATSTANSSQYGLTLINVSVIPSTIAPTGTPPGRSAYYDAIDVTNTPTLISGGTIGSGTVALGIGATGVNATFDSSSLPGPTLSVTGVTFASVGADAIMGSFQPGQQVAISNNTVNRAGLFGIQLSGADNPTIRGNTITCAGKPNITTCDGTGVSYPAIYLSELNNANFAGTSTSGISNNSGKSNGLDAIVFDGSVNRSFTWASASAPNTLATSPLTYVLDNGLTVLHGATLTVPAGQAVKGLGTISIEGGALSANGATFTSLRDDAAGLKLCQSTSFFVQDFGCPATRQANEWGGISVTTDSAGNQGTATITNSTVRYGDPGIFVNSGQLAGSNPYPLTVTDSVIGPSQTTAIRAVDSPIKVLSSLPCASAAVCTTRISSLGQGIGINLGAPVAAAIDLENVGITSTGGDGIFAGGLHGQPITVKNNRIDHAGHFGINLQDADQLTLQNNTITNSGATPNPADRFSAIYLPNLTGDLANAIAGNTGFGNGVDATVLHGLVNSSFAWSTNVIPNGTAQPLQYVLDGDLTVATPSGATRTALTMPDNSVLEAAPGSTLLLKSADLIDNGTAGKVFGSLSDTTLGTGVSACPSHFVSVCGSPAAIEWDGISLTGNSTLALTNASLSYATTAIQAAPGTSVTLIGSSIAHTTSDAINATGVSLLSVTNNSTISHVGGSGILAGGSPMTIQNNQFSDIARDAISAGGLTGKIVHVEGNTIQAANGFGIRLVDAGRPASSTAAAPAFTLKNNVINGSGTTAPISPAVLLHNVNGNFVTDVANNSGAGNGLDALAFDGKVTSDLDWQSRSNVTPQLGYLLDGDLTMGATTLTVHAGDIVKSLGAITLNGGTLDASRTLTASKKVFTSLQDNGVGLTACPSVLIPGCTGPNTGDWGGLIVHAASPTASPNLAGATLVNGVIRYATTGIDIDSGATSAPGTSSFGLSVAQTTIGPVTGDAITAQDTPVSVTGGSINGTGGRGISVEMAGAPAASPLRLSGIQISNTGSDGVLATYLGNKAVWITDNRVRNTGGFGIRLEGADGIVLRNNFICGSGFGPTTAACGAGRTAAQYFPAIYLDGVTADFTRNIRGNFGFNNGLDAIVFHGIATGGLTWMTPGINTALQSLGYLADGDVRVEGGTFTVSPGTVRVLHGGIEFDGSKLNAIGSSFTSLLDPSGLPVCSPAGQSPIVTCRAPRPGDWNGLNLVADQNLNPSGTASAPSRLTNSTVAFAMTGVSVLDGSYLNVTDTDIENSSVDGIDNFDSTVNVTGTLPAVWPMKIHGSGSRGINALLTGSSTGSGLSVTNTLIDTAGREGILANTSNGQPVAVSGSRVTGAKTYGIHLIGTTSPTLDSNQVDTSGGANGTSTAYPAIYLDGVTNADFTPTGSGVRLNHGSGNGLDAITLHGSTSGPLAWLPALVNLTNISPFGYLADGGLTVNGDLTVGGPNVVKVWNGAIVVNGGNLLAAADALPKVFTSLADNSVGLGSASACPSALLHPCPAAAPGQWNGIVMGPSPTGVIGYASFNNSTISFDDNAITVPPNAAQDTDGFSLQFVGSRIHDVIGNGINVIGDPVKVVKSTFVMVPGDAIQVSNSSGDVITDNAFEGIGGAAVRSTNIALPLDCLAVASGAITGDSGLSVTQSDMLATPALAPVAGATIQATSNFWNGLNGAPALGQIAPDPTTTVNTAPVLATRKPTVTIDFMASNPTATNNPPTHLAFGAGNLTLHLTFSRKMNTDADPMVVFTGPHGTYSIAPLPGTAHWVPGSSTEWQATYPLNANTADQGLNTLTVSDARSCVPVPPSESGVAPPPNQMAAATSHAFYAALKPTTVNVLGAPSSGGVYTGPADLAATVTSNGSLVKDADPNAPVHFSLLDAGGVVRAQDDAAVDQTTGQASAHVANLPAFIKASPPLGPALSTLEGTFRGDDQYSPSSTASNAFSVDRAATVTGLSSAPSNSGTGDVTLTASVTHDNAAVPAGADPSASEGAVEFSFASGPSVGTLLTCANALPGTLAGTPAQATCTAALSDIGGFDITAAFVPAALSNYKASTTTLTGTTTILSTQATDGSGVTLTAKVTPAGGTAYPTGTVVFTGIDSTNAQIAISCSNTTPTAGGNDLALAQDGTTIASKAVCNAVFPSNTTTNGIGGLKSLAATYTPTGAFAPSDDSLTGTSVSLDPPDPNPPSSGSSFTLTAKVSHLDGSTDPVSGSVLFFDTTSPTTPISACGGANGESLAGTGTNANTASCILTRSTGAYSFTAVYKPPAAGNSFDSSLSGTRSFNVDAISTDTSLGTSASDSTNVKLEAAVTASAGAASPTGSVAFTGDSSGTAVTISCSNTVALTPDALDPTKSEATCDAAFGSSGSSQGIGGLKALTATYTPAVASDFAGSSASLTGSSVSLGAPDPNPPLSGAPFTLTATVSHLDGISDPSSGSVLFFEGAPPAAAACSNGINGTNEVSLVGTGSNPNTASCSLTRATDAYSFIGVYNPPGSGNGFGSSLSGAKSVTVNDMTTSTALTTNATDASGVTLTAIVTPDGGMAYPDGKVTFTGIDSTDTSVDISCSNTPTPGGSQLTLTQDPVDSSKSQATCDAVFPSGSGIQGIDRLKSLKATYAPGASSKFAASHGGVTGTSVSLGAPDPNPPLSNAPFTLTATVTHLDGSNDPVSGTVDFFKGTTPMCSAVGLASNANTATCTVNNLPTASYSFTAVYNPPAAGNGFGSSLSVAKSVTVNDMTTSTALTTSATDPDGVTLTATVTPTAGNDHPTGTVTFTGINSSNASVDISCSNTTPTAGGNELPLAQVPSTASCHAVFPSSSGIQGIDGLKSLKATYVPSGDFAASYDTLTGSQTGLTASNPAPNSGDNFTLTATVNSLGTSGDPAAGSVLFFENGSSTPLPDCGGASGEALKGGTGADANTASCTLSRPTASYSYTVVYNPPSSGNGFGGSLSGPANVAVN